MKKILQKLRRILNIEDELQLTINSFQIGYQSFIIFELKEKKEIIKNELITKLLLSELNLFWFRSYFEFETYFDVIMSDELINFILIG